MPAKALPAPGRQDDGKLKQHPVVIPAKAGIQWFMSYIPALAGMTIRQDWRSFHIPARPPGFRLSPE